MNRHIQILLSSTLGLCCVFAASSHAAGANPAQFAPPGYLPESAQPAAPIASGHYPSANYAPQQNYYTPQTTTPQYGYGQNYYTPQPAAPQYGGAQTYNNYGAYNGYNSYSQPFYPSYQLPPGYNYSLPQQQYGYAPQQGYNNPYGPMQRRLPPRRPPVEDEPFSLIPWDHFPGGGMPDFNPFSQGPTKGLPSKMFDTPMKDWSVEQFGDVWEDALNAPHNMGRLPGNFQAPSVSVPNPIDLGDQMGDATATASEEAPEVIQGWFD